MQDVRHAQVFVSGVEAGSGIRPSLPGLIGVDEFQSAIPWRVALQSRSPPFHRRRSACDKVILPVEQFPANAEPSFMSLS